MGGRGVVPSGNLSLTTEKIPLIMFTVCIDSSMIFKMHCMERYSHFSLVLVQVVRVRNTSKCVHASRGLQEKVC